MYSNMLSRMRFYLKFHCSPSLYPRNQMKAHLLMNSESQDTLFEDIGTQVST